MAPQRALAFISVLLLLPATAIAAPHHPLSDIYPMDVPLDLEGQPIEDSTGAATIEDTLNMSGNEIIDYVSDARSNAPTDPAAGQLWFDSGQNILKYYNGTRWVITASADSVSSDLQSALGAGNQAGSYDINMSGQDLTNTGFITFEDRSGDGTGWAVAEEGANELTFDYGGTNRFVIGSEGDLSVNGGITMDGGNIVGADKLETGRYARTPRRLIDILLEAEERYTVTTSNGEETSGAFNGRETGYWDVTSGEQPATLTVDFGRQIYNIDGVMLSGDWGCAGYPVSYKLERYWSGSWTTIVDETNNNECPVIIDEYFDAERLRLTLREGSYGDDQAHVQMSAYNRYYVSPAPNRLSINGGRLYGNLDVDGDLGLGVSSTNSRLHLDGDIRLNNGKIMADKDETGNNAMVVLQRSSEDASTGIIKGAESDNANNAQDLAINPDGGNTGIGTHSPDNALDIMGGDLDMNSNDITGISSNSVDITASEGSQSVTMNNTDDALNGVRIDSGDFVAQPHSGNNSNIFAPFEMPDSDGVFFTEPTSAGDNSVDLRMYMEDDGDGSERFSIWGGSCDGDCWNISYSDELFRFGSDGELDLFQGRIDMNDNDIDNVDTLNANTKNFVQQINETHEAVYTAQESGDARAIIEGSTTVNNGSTRIELPDHFDAVVSDTRPDLNVQVTPIGSEAMPVRVVQKGTEVIAVEQIIGEPHEFTIDYRISGIRDGHEDKDVIREQ